MRVFLWKSKRRTKRVQIPVFFSGFNSFLYPWLFHKKAVISGLLQLKLSTPMKKLFTAISLICFIASCTTGQTSTPKDYEEALQLYSQSILPESLEDKLYVFASEEFEGRGTGQPGQLMAAEYVREIYKNLGIASPESLYVENYFQTIPQGTFPRIPSDVYNILGYIEGSEFPEEVLILSAHYDHLGKINDEIYYGADDDGSGSVALIEIAAAFQKAVRAGYTPKRSILFLHVTAEEIGLLGSRFYTDKQPVFPLENTIANLNIDMIGRHDKAHAENPNYIYLIGSDRLSRDLHELSEETNRKYGGLELDYSYNVENEPNRLYFRSDHYNFAKNNVPIIFYFSGLHEDYHRVTDTADKIDYDMLAKRARLIFATAWELANAENRPQLN